jgi:antitoxin HicB
MKMDYPIVISPLSDEDGGGFVGVAPDLLGCMSDGETPEEALANTQQAVREWIETATRRGMEVPPPGTAPVPFDNAA